MSIAKDSHHRRNQKTSETNDNANNGAVPWVEPRSSLFPPLDLPFRHSVVEGYIYPPTITRESIDKTRRFQLREDDVFIATFPKCGTTWTQNIIYKLHQAHETGVFEGFEYHLLDAIPWLENSDHRQLSQRPSPRHIKTHNPYEHLAKDPVVPCKYIYVTRDPKDTCVSLYHHLRGLPVFQYTGGDFLEFGELFLEGKVESGDWWWHVEEYMINRNGLNILVIKYEDLHDNLHAAIRKINSFVGLPELSLDKIGFVIRETKFAKMKDDPRANFSWRQHRRKKGESPFMRKGQVGDWANYFTQELADRFNTKTRQYLGKYKFFDCYTSDDNIYS